MRAPWRPRRALPAPRRTATLLFHAERASARSRTSAYDMPALRAASASSATVSPPKWSKTPLPALENLG
jgi:hypothetical protein